MDDNVNYDENDFSLDGGNYSPSDLDSSGSIRKPGHYHFEITEVKDELSHLQPGTGRFRSPSICFVCTALASPPDGDPVGSKAYFRIKLRNCDENGVVGPPSEFNIKQALSFGIGIGLLAPKRIEEEDREIVVVKETGSTNITPRVWAQAANRQFIGKIEHFPAKGQFKEKWGFAFNNAFHPCDDPSLAHVACDEEALASIGIVRRKPTSPTPTPAPKSAPAPVAAAAAATDVPLDF